MKLLAKQNRELIMINAQNTQNENDAEKIILKVPEQYEDFNKKIVFVTPAGNVWDIITNNEYLIPKAITKYKQVDFYIWLTQGNVDFRTQTKTLKFYDNVDASGEITPEEISGVNTVVNLLEEEITKVNNLETEIDGKLEEIDTAIDNVSTAIQETENLDLDAEKVGQTTTITLTKKDGTVKTVHVDDGYDDTEIKNDISAINANIKARLEQIETDLNNCESVNESQSDTIAEHTTSINANTTEITNARQSTIKDKTFASVDARIEELEEDVDKIEAVSGHIYGVRRKITNNTSTAWERIKDSVGLIANATKNGGIVVNNFDELAPWSEIKSCNYDLGTGEVKAWFGDATFNFNGSNGDVFTYIPDVYLKIYQEDDYDYILLSDRPRSGFTKYDSFFIARYTGSVVSDKLHSYSGLTPTVGKTIAQFRTLTRALGDKFSLLDYRYFIIQMLYLVEYANYNCQSMLGNGVMSRAWTGQWNGLDAGGCDSLGMKSGCLVNDGKNSVIYRGIENLYGNMWQFVDGITVVNRVAYICKDHSQYADSKTTSPYKQLGYVNGDTNGWTKNLGFDPDEPLARFPVEVGGSNASGTGDNYYQDAGTRLALVGGVFAFEANDGLWCWGLSSFFSDSYVHMGCRVLIDNQ